MRIAICDDEHTIRNCIKEILYDNTDLSIYTDIQEAVCGEELIEKHKISPFDIIFLDIEMSGISGIETGHTIRKMDRDAIIIFITSHKQYVLESFTVEAFDFIEKPIEADKIKKTLQRAIRKYKDQHYIINYRWQGISFSLDISDIVSIEAFRGRVLFQTTSKKGEYECNGSLDDYERDLQIYGFLRTHRNALINMRYIKRIEDNVIITSCNSEVEMSARKKQSCLRAYNKYLVKYRV